MDRITKVKIYELNFKKERKQKNTFFREISFDDRNNKNLWEERQKIKKNIKMRKFKENLTQKG